MKLKSPGEKNWYLEPVWENENGDTGDALVALVGEKSLLVYPGIESVK